MFKDIFQAIRLTYTHHNGTKDYKEFPFLEVCVVRTKYRNNIGNVSLVDKNKYYDKKLKLWVR